MKINLTNKQYRLLLDLVYAGSWLINSHRDQGIKEYDEVESYIFSFAKDFGLDNLVDYVREADAYYPSREFEESKVDGFIDEYDDNNFWGELAARLAARDIDEAGPVEPEDGRSAQETRAFRIWEREDHYNDVFVENGLKNIRVALKTPTLKE